MKRFVLSFLFFCLTGSAQAALVYQNFETGNGTPPPYGSPKDTPGEYGWGFNGAAIGRSDSEDPVHSGKYSWKVNIPAGEPVHAGSCVPAQFQTYNVNFIPECHDRLTFWIWSEPSSVGDHTVMVKFFDQGAYKQGIGIWTTEPASYQKWTKLTILFSQLPADFNLHRVDKIEFFHYWDGTYYYDDIEVASAASAAEDLKCLEKNQFVSRSLLSSPTSPGERSAFFKRNPVLGISTEAGSPVYQTFFQDQGLFVLDLWQAQSAHRATVIKDIASHEPR